MLLGWPPSLDAGPGDDDDCASIHLFDPPACLVAALIQKAHLLTVPIFMIHGDADDTVDISMSQQYADALSAATVPVTFKPYPGRGHSELLFHALTEEPGRLITDVTTFANACP
jgi:acetyl esterase/lipase